MSNQVIKSISLLFLICLLGFPQISETIYTPSLPDLATSLNVAMGTAEYTLSVYFVGFAFGVLTFGILSDWIGRRKSMMTGILIYFISSIGCMLCKSIEAILIMRFLQAFGASVGSVVTQTILRDLYQGTERRRIFSIASGALAFSPALGPVIGGVVNQLWNWKGNFFILFFIGLVLWLLSFSQLPETQTKSPKITQAWMFTLAKRMLTDPILYFYSFLIGGCNGIIFSYYAEAPYIFINLLGLKPSFYGLLGLVIASSFFLASLLSIRLNSKIHFMDTTAVGAGLSLVGSLLFWRIASVNIFLPTAGIGVLMPLIGSIFLTFLGIGTMIPNCLSHALDQYQSESGSAGALFGFAYYWTISGFTALMGTIHNGSPQTMPIYFSVLTSTMLVLCLSMKFKGFKIVLYGC